MTPKQYFVCINSKNMDKIMQWLNTLLGSIQDQGGEVTKLIAWQVVPTGRPYEYSAFAQVEIQNED